MCFVKGLTVEFDKARVKNIRDVFGGIGELYDEVPSLCLDHRPPLRFRGEAHAKPSGKSGGDPADERAD